MTRLIEFEEEAHKGLGSDHIHLVQKNGKFEDIAISECCRGQNTI